MFAAVLEAWLWLVPAFVLGAAGGWIGRMTFDRKTEAELSAEVKIDVARIEQLEAEIRTETAQIHMLEEELSTYRALKDASRARVSQVAQGMNPDVRVG